MANDYGHETRQTRAYSDPEEDYNTMIEQKKKKSAFPRLYDYCGYLDIRTRTTKSWKRKYFVLANNFLLMSSTPYSSKLEKVIPLEGSNVKTTTKTSPLMFEILIRKKRNQFRAPNESECNQWTEKIQRASRLKIKDIYRFDAILGTNATGSTKVLSAKHRVTGEDVAVKVISKKEYNPAMLSNEVLILKRLDHPHVVKLFDLFETRKCVYLVMEKCNGGELFEEIANIKGGGGFSEKECIMVLHQIAKAVKYMHSMGIVHRDLKPENILCVYPHSIETVKIADFGISKVIFDPETRKKEKEEKRRQQKRFRTLQQRAQQLQEEYDQVAAIELIDVDDQKQMQMNRSNPGSPRMNKRKSRKKKFIDPLKKRSKHKKKRLSKSYHKKRRFDLMNTMCGTISYTAPEILREKPYDKRVDYWSLGVIAFILLCGYPPFWGDTELDVAHSILGSKVQLDADDWIHVSENGKRLVLGLLERNPHKRLGVDDILKHTWTYASKTHSVSKKQRKSFIKTVAKRRIRKMSMGVFEKNSKRMDYIYRHHKGKTEEDTTQSASPSAVSPMSLERQTSGSQHSATASAFSYSDFTNQPQQASRNSVSYSNDFRRWSRTDDDLFELRLPSMSLTPRGQAALDPAAFGDDDDDDAFALDMRATANGRRTSRKYSQ
eukprot:261708_1